MLSVLTFKSYGLMPRVVMRGGRPGLEFDGIIGGRKYQIEAVLTPQLLEWLKATIAESEGGPRADYDAVFAPQPGAPE